MTDRERDHCDRIEEYDHELGDFEMQVGQGVVARNPRTKATMLRFRLFGSNDSQPVPVHRCSLCFTTDLRYSILPAAKDRQISSKLNCFRNLLRDHCIF